jgi:hypothetical protein
MRWARRVADARDEKWIQELTMKIELRRCRREDNIKTNLRKIIVEEVEWNKTRTGGALFPLLR